MQRAHFSARRESYDREPELRIRRESKTCLSCNHDNLFLTFFVPICVMQRTRFSWRRVDKRLRTFARRKGFDRETAFSEEEDYGD